ncbi:MAG TPA: hypothetical protein VFV22_01590 [Candidatus Paceibacterota bacterium]|nr:hypothetical protein [Candidatus Paceibacterota bacterium]
MDTHQNNNQNTTSPTHHGPVLGLLVIILVVILGGLYLWGSILNTQEPVAPQVINNEPETPRAEADIEISRTLSSSDEIDAIETDIVNTNLDSIDADIQAMDIEFQNSLGM